MSWYGPMFNDTEPADIVIKTKEHRYYYVHEDPELESKWEGDKMENMQIRYFLLTKDDCKGRIPLHLSCMFGDHHFTFFLVKEAIYLKKQVRDGSGGTAFQITEEILNKKDRDGLTPLFHLCEKGYRPKVGIDRQAEELEEEILEQ